MHTLLNIQLYVSTKKGSESRDVVEYLVIWDDPKKPIIAKGTFFAVDGANVYPAIANSYPELNYRVKSVVHDVLNFKKTLNYYFLCSDLSMDQIGQRRW